MHRLVELAGRGAGQPSELLLDFCHRTTEECDLFSHSIDLSGKFIEGTIVAMSSAARAGAIVERPARVRGGRGVWWDGRKVRWRLVGTRGQCMR